jgi:hypothetical protein
MMPSEKLENGSNKVDKMFGYTIIGRDGGEAYTSEPEYNAYQEAYKAGDHTLCDMNEGSLEVWEED